MVHGRARARGRTALSDDVCGGGVTAAGVGDSIRRLCGVAARVVARGSAGAAVGLLAETVGWCLVGAGVAERPRASGRAEFSRFASTFCYFRTTHSGLERVEPARRRDALYDAAGGVQNVALSVYEPG